METMSTDLQKQPDQALQQIDSANMMQAIIKAASDPAVDADKMERMLAMAERIQDRQALVAYSEAMARIQASMPRVTKSGSILDKFNQVRSTYAKYEDIDLAVRPLLAAEGFSVNYDTEFSAGLLIVTIEVRHAGGHSEKRRTFMPKNTSPGSSDAQNMGGTISYGKRYAFCQFFNIITVDVDQDGQDENQPITEDQAREIEDMLLELGERVNVEKFLEVLEAATVRDIPASKHEWAKAQLLKRLSK